MKCSSCGNEVREGEKFCRACGKEIAEANNGCFCKACGRRINAGASFCDHCGTQVGSIGNAAQIPKYTPLPKKKKPDTVLIVLIAVLGVVVVACLATVGILMIQNVFSGVSNNTSVVQDQDGYDDSGYDFDDNSNTNSNVTYSDYLFPSDTVYITASDLYGKSKEEVALIRNEIYARHGYIFKTEPYKTYFPQKSWYTANPDFNESSFNAVEKANKDFLVSYEQSMGWR